MKTECLTRILVVGVVLGVVTQSSGQRNADRGTTAAQVEFARGGPIALAAFTLENGPLEAQIGDSKTTIGLDRVSAIEVQASKPGGSDSVTLTVRPAKGGSPLTIQREGWHHIRGTVVSGETRYTFHTRLSMCKRITLTPSPSAVAPTYREESVSCTVTSTNGTTQSLADVQAFETYSADTGYSRGFIGFPVRNDVYTSTDKLSLVVTNGVIDIGLAHIKKLDLATGTLTLRNDDTISVLKPGKSVFDGRIISGSGGAESTTDYFAALAGWAGEQYTAIKPEDIREVVTDKTVPGKKIRTPQTPANAAPLKKLAVTDTKGQTQQLESATIVSPYGILSMGRILMNRCYPNWYVAGSGQFQSVASSDEFLSHIAVGQDGFWTAIPIADIAKWTKGKDRAGTLILRSGKTMAAAQLEFGEIKGNGTWGEVKYGSYNVAGFAIEDK